MQKDDFRGIFRAMRGLPVTIRLIDPPLHEFLPTDPAVLEALAREKGIPISRIHKRVEELKEANPMLGHRGVRLLISYPEIYEMQVEAIIEAAIEVAKDGFEVHPEIMIPLVSTRSEIKAVKDGIVGEKKEIIARGIYQIATEMMCRMGKVIPFTLGTMIELPRAALVADEIAKEAEFFSFGTNDLTQMTFGFSRDDAQRSFLPVYKEKGILGEDPFKTIDIDGVGQLIRMGVEKGRQARKDLKIGICGEHGGDPKSVEFCHRAGLNYVSCSGFRVPVARLAAARAAVLEKSHDV
jgi:pyruvate,orthophosphate dikinase